MCVCVCVCVWEGVWGNGEGVCVSVVRGEGEEVWGSHDEYVWVHVCVNVVRGEREEE